MYAKTFDSVLIVEPKVDVHGLVFLFSTYPQNLRLIGKLAISFFIFPEKYGFTFATWLMGINVSFPML